MDAATIGALTSLLLAVGGGVAWLIRRRDTKKDPLPKQVAELALAAQALGIITDAAAWNRKDTENLRADRDADRERIAQLEADRETDRARITRLETLLSTAAAYIEALLRWARLMPTDPVHPIPPLPEHLHELVDPHLWVSPKETT